MQICNTYFQIFQIDWYHYNLDGHRRHIQSQDGRYVFTQDQGLVIIGLGDQEGGQYDCRVNHETITSYRVIVDFKRCSVPEKSGEYQKAYVEWCNEFQKYRSALQSWEEKQTSCMNGLPISTAETAFQQSSNNPFF